MGEVYRATDTRLHREVALKVLPEEMASDPERLERFRREARALAALDHPGIVTVFSVEEAEGLHFLTMQLADGRPLEHLLSEPRRRNGLPLDELLSISRGLAEALAAAHVKNIVHRDLKPANVMVAEDGSVKILDFGLAKLSQPEVSAEEETRSMGLTRAGVVMGTVPYMSPEQLQGRDVTPSTDVFSFGVLLHEMATGTRPFDADSQAGLVSAILKDEPGPITRFRPDVPEAFARIVARCLEKEPERRYADAGQLCRDLEALTEGHPEDTPSLSSPEENPPFLERRRYWGLLGLVVILAVALGSVLLVRWRAPVPENGTPSVAVLPFVDLSPEGGDTYLGDGIAETLISSLSNVPEIGVAARTSAFSFRGEDVDARRIGRELEVEAVLEGSVQRIGERLRVTAQLVDTSDGLNLWSESFDRDTSDIFAVQDEVARAVVTALRGRLLTTTPDGDTGTRDPAAYDAYLQGRFYWNQRSLTDLQRSIEYFELAIERDPGFARAWAGLADAHVTLPFYSALPTSQEMPEARHAAERALALDPDSAEGLTTLAYLQALYEWDWEAADRGFRRALESNAGYTNALKWYSDVLSILGRDQEALVTVERAVELDPLSPNNQTILGLKHWFAGRDEEARARFDRALELDPRFPLTLMHESWLCWTAGDLECFFATRDVLESVLGDGRATGAELTAAFAQGGRDAVIRAMLASPFVERSPVDRARWHAQAGDFDAAFRDLERALDERPVWLPFVVNFPDLARLREDARFEQVAARMGLSGR